MLARSEPLFTLHTVDRRWD